MMFDDQQTAEAAILAALKRQAARVTQIAPGTWRFRLPEGAGPGATARVRPGWLTLELAACGRAAPEAPWALLHRNARAGPGVKFALAAGDPVPRLHGELPLDPGEPAEFERRIAALIERMMESSVGGRSEQAADVDGACRDAPAEAPPTPVARLVEEAGWSFADRPGGSVAVSLEVPRRFIQAQVEPSAGGRVTVSARLTDGEAPPAQVNREALAALLLVATGSVRLARAAAIEEPDGAVVTRIETVLPPAGGARHLHHALSALSVACGLCAVEAELLHDDPVVAEAYLASRDGPGPSVRNDH